MFYKSFKIASALQKYLFYLALNNVVKSLNVIQSLNEKIYI